MSVIHRPCVWTLPSSLKTLYVADLNKDDEAQRRATFQLIADAAQRADNVGVDEFTEEWFDLVLHYTDVAVTLSELAERSRAPGRLLGLVTVSRTRFCRSNNPGTCQLFMFAAKELGGHHTWRDLARLGTTLVAEAKRPYAACVVKVFVPCLERVLALRDEGFVITACVPRVGILSGHSDHCDSYIMYKALDLYDMSKFTLAVTAAEEENDEESPFTLGKLPDYLPCRYGVDGGRIQITVRPLRPDEVRDFYAALKEAAASGKGYGFDELSRLSYFIRFCVDGAYCMVYELASSNEDAKEVRKPTIIGYGNFGPSMWSRSRHKAEIADAMVVFRPEFRGRRWSADLLRVSLALMVDSGFRWLMSDTNITNLPILTVTRSLGFTGCGTIPRGIYLPGRGWVDLFLGSRPLRDLDSSEARKMMMKSKM